jgi:hypothetical protein
MRVRITQYVRVGHRRWLTQVEGLVEKEGRRPVGGIEMGGKASYCQQETLMLRRDDGELTEIAVDEETQVETVPDPASRAEVDPPPDGQVQTVASTGP